MITIKPGQNTCVFTLNEKFGFYNPSVASYPDLYYFFRITNQLTENVIDFTIDATMDTGDGVRYNEFIIDVNNPGFGTSPYTPNYGCIGLTGPNEDYLSQWTYEVWGCQGPMPTSGTPSMGLTFSSLETGRLLYKI